MGESGTSESDDFAGLCAAREQLERELERMRDRQDALVMRALEDHVLPRLAEVATDLGFAIAGRRARGLAVELAGRAQTRRFFVLHDEEAWQLIERHAHGLSAVVTPVSVRGFVDAFGREAIAALLAAAAAAAAAAALLASAAPARAHPSARPVPARERHVVARRNTLECPHCDAEPNAENLARHLREIHGVEPGARPMKRPSRSAHEHCRLCDVRLPAGRLDAHLTVRHGVFRVHPHGAALGDAGAESRREAARRFTRAPRGQLEMAANAARGTIAGVKAPSGAGRAGASGAARVRGDLGGSLVHSPAAGRDFLRETRTERALVARAESPEHNRDRAGRFSDAPDVERMDGESDA